MKEKDCIFCREPETELICENRLARDLFDKNPAKEGQVLNPLTGIAGHRPEMQI